MIVVVDASVIVAELLRRRGRELLARPELQCLVAEEQWGEAQHELDKLVGVIVGQGRLTSAQGQQLLHVVPRRFYEHMEGIARRRVPRDPADWAPVALTGLVYAADLPYPAREDDPTTAPMPYPASKVTAERSLRESGLTWSILRFAFVYGDGDGHLQSAPELLGGWNWHPAATLSLIHHRDIAVAIVLALDGAMDSKVVNLTDDAPRRSPRSHGSSAPTTPSRTSP